MIITIGFCAACNEECRQAALARERAERGDANRRASEPRGSPAWSAMAAKAYADAEAEARRRQSAEAEEDRRRREAEEKPHAAALVAAGF